MQPTTPAAFALATLIVLAAPGEVRAHDNAEPHVHIKGRIVVAQGQSLPGRPDARVDPGVFPGLPCAIKSVKRPDYNPSDGTYELVVTVQGTGPGRGGCAQALSTAPAIAVDRSKIHWEVRGWTIVPR